MTIYLEFHNLIIQRSRFQDRFPGGWEYFLGDYNPPADYAVWFDDDLIRFGAMSGNDIEHVVQDFEAMGLALTTARNGTKEFLDMCLISAMAGGMSLPCAWLEYNSDGPGEFVEYLGEPSVRWTKHPVGQNFLYLSELLSADSTGWPNEERAHTRVALTERLSARERWPETLLMKNFDGNRGRLKIVQKEDLPLTIEGTVSTLPARFRNISEIIWNGWAVD